MAFCIQYDERARYDSGESRFPGGIQIPDPVNIFIVFPIPALHFGQILFMLYSNQLLTGSMLYMYLRNRGNQAENNKTRLFCVLDSVFSPGASGARSCISVLSGERK